MALAHRHRLLLHVWPAGHELLAVGHLERAETQEQDQRLDGLHQDLLTTKAAKLIFELTSNIYKKKVCMFEWKKYYIRMLYKMYFQRSQQRALTSCVFVPWGAPDWPVYDPHPTTIVNTPGHRQCD